MDFWALLVCVRVSQMAFTDILRKTATRIDSVFCHHITYGIPSKLVNGVSEQVFISVFTQLLPRHFSNS